MSVRLMSAIFETEFRDLRDAEGNVTKGSTAKLVLLALADHANDDGEGAYPGLTKMEKKTALSRQGILNTYDALKYNGIIYLVGESKLGTNNYTINTVSFPSMRGGQPTLLVNPLDSGGKPTLPEVVNPLDLNHPLTVIESSVANEEKPDLVDLELQKKAKQDGIEPALQAFERDMQTPGNWSWYPAKTTLEKEWRELREFVGKLYAENPNCFSEYHTWRNQPYVKGAMSNRQIKNYPADFQASWSDYCAHSAMYPVKNQPPVSNVKRSSVIQYDDDGTPITF